MAPPKIGSLNRHRKAWMVSTFLLAFIIAACWAKQDDVPLGSASTGHFRSLISDDRFRKCLSDLDQASSYGMLRPQDFDDFTRVYSDGKSSAGQFKDLPSSLITKFNSLSCSFCSNDDRFVPTSCCSGNVPYIDLSTISPDQLRFLCIAVDQIYGTPSPSPSLTLAPTPPPAADSEAPASLITGATPVLISDERFRECLTDVDQAAYNGTLRVQDFDDFIRIYSDGKYNGVQFKDLPSSLITKFNSLTCTICANDYYYIQFNCCSGDVPYIDLSTISPVKLRYLCSAVDEIYGVQNSTLPPKSHPVKTKPSTTSLTKAPMKAPPIQGTPKPSARFPVSVAATKKPMSLFRPKSGQITSLPTISGSPSTTLTLSPTKIPLSTAKRTSSPTHRSAPSANPSKALRKSGAPTSSPSLRPKTIPVKKSPSFSFDPSTVRPTLSIPTITAGRSNSFSRPCSCFPYQNLWLITLCSVSLYYK